MFKNRKLTLPDWVNWLAQDEDGTWWGFEAEPHQSHNAWYENEVGRYVRVKLDKPNPAWQQSLLQVRTSIRSEPEIPPWSLK